MEAKEFTNIQTLGNPAGNVLEGIGQLASDQVLIAAIKS
jgi:hypothetical protein